jgi:hypothetical protein
MGSVYLYWKECVTHFDATITTIITATDCNSVAAHVTFVFAEITII